MSAQPGGGADMQGAREGQESDRATPSGAHTEATAAHAIERTLPILLKCKSACISLDMFIPLGDDNSGRRSFPLIAWIVFGVNAFVWYLQLTLGETFTLGYSAVPFELTNSVDLTSPKMAMIGGENISIPQAPGPVPIQLTMLSAMFMHGSWEHIIGNMMYLLIFGDQVEDMLGKLRFVIFYLACGICASLAHVIIEPESVVPSLGASGAIAGLLGAYLVSHPSNRVRVLFFRDVIYMPAYVVLGGWLALQLVSQVGVFAGQASGVAYMAHIGGFLAGVPLYYLLRKRDY